MTAIVESTVEQAALEWLQDVGWSVAAGSEFVADDSLVAERGDYREAILRQRLRDALARLNPDLPSEAVEDALRKLMAPEGADLVSQNRALHRMLVDGVTVEYADRDGAIRGAQVRVIDYDDPEANEFLAVNQFTVQGESGLRRADVVLFVNGLALAVFELKSATATESSIWHAYNQLQTYKGDVPALFVPNELLLISDGNEARVGTLTADRDRFSPWRTIDGETLADESRPQLEVAIRGLCDPSRFLRMVRDFIVFEDKGGGPLSKKMAAYHQFHAVETAVAQTLRAAALARGEARDGIDGVWGDRRIGVVWHTQGSGKSLTMVFYTGRLVREPAMENPTIVVLTDRNDLDDQLFGTFARCQDVLRQPPVQAESRAHLRELLSVSSGGIVFTTIHKFFPEEKGDRHPCLSERRNIVVIADEAHRSQYDFIDGFARHMRDALPNASFIGFTGTPVELDDRNTRAVFGDYISIYDIERAVADGATVPIYYESRLAKLDLAEEERPRIDPQFEEVTEGEEVARKEKLKTKWSQLEAIVGADRRLDLLARDIVEHFERRLEALDGKGMVVCMSRRICVELYDRIARLRPQWVDDDDTKGWLKVVMTGSPSDPPEWQRHIRNKERREKLADRFRDPADPFRLVIVRDMWLTGFDAPSLHTMYLDKPMRGHTLMQAIARVNRVFRDKPGGLVVDYLGLARDLKEAIATYTDSGGKGEPVIDVALALDVLREKYEVCCGLFHGFDWHLPDNAGAAARLNLLRDAEEHILALPPDSSGADGKQRLLRAVSELSRAYALVATEDEARKVRDDVAFFQSVARALRKRTPGEAQSDEELDLAVRQIVSRAIQPEGVVDIFSAAGLRKPDISVLSEEFLEEVRGMQRRNLAVDVLQRLLESEVKARQRRNVVQARSFAVLLERTIRKYQNRTVEAAQVIEELIALARQLREADARGEQLGLSEDELAFYDALAQNQSAVEVLGDETLRAIARELVQKVRSNVTIDWTIRENVRANLRRIVKRVLRKHKYPPDKQEAATQLVLEQAEALSEEWVARGEVARAPRLRLVHEPSSAERWVTCVPLLPVEVAAGAFGAAQVVDREEWEWVAVDGRPRLGRDYFVAQVKGKSMEPEIPDGSFCLFRLPGGGSRQGRIVLAELLDQTDPDSGSRFTVKRYESEKESDPEGGWRHARVRLRPVNPDYPVLELDSEDNLRIIAELVQLLGTGVAGE